MTRGVNKRPSFPSVDPCEIHDTRILKPLLLVYPQIIRPVVPHNTILPFITRVSLRLTLG